LHRKYTTSSLGSIFAFCVQSGHPLPKVVSSLLLAYRHLHDLVLSSAPLTHRPCKVVQGTEVGNGLACGLGYIV